MNRALFFTSLLLASLFVQADGVILTKPLKQICSVNYSDCEICTENRFLFPLETLSNDTDALEVEADRSEVIENQDYLITGNVKLKSYNNFLAADKVVISKNNNTSTATGSVSFQDNEFLLTGDSLIVEKINNEFLVDVSNANYQEIKSKANGTALTVNKTEGNALLTQSTYSLCPVNDSDWVIRADLINLDLKNNRATADNATLLLFGAPIFYVPKYSWVTSGRGSGFLSPGLNLYKEIGNKKNYVHTIIPYYLNLAPDRDLLIALSFLSSRGAVFGAEYRQLISTQDNPKAGLFEFESQNLFSDKITGKNRWLIDTSLDLDITETTNIKLLINQVSDKDYFMQINRSHTELSRLKSSMELSYNNPPEIKEDESDEDKILRQLRYSDLRYANQSSIKILSETEQVVNNGSNEYTKPLEVSLKQKIKSDTLPFRVNMSFITSNFDHKETTKTTGNRTHAEIELSKTNRIGLLNLNTSTDIGFTQYYIKNKNNQNRIIGGFGLGLSLPYSKESSLFGYEVMHKLEPKISYDFKAKKEQKLLPLFDTADNIKNLITYESLITGKRYSGIDRIVNENDITISLESDFQDMSDDGDGGSLLNFKIAQRFYGDDDAVSAANDILLNPINYEKRRKYSDIAASLDITVNDYLFESKIQFDPKNISIVKKELEITFEPHPRKFISLTHSDNGTDSTIGYSGAYPLSKQIHLFGAISKSITTKSILKQTSGIAYEDCCWSARIAHFKEAYTNLGSTQYDYSTGFELVFKGLGSTDTNLRNHIEKNIPKYKAILSESKYEKPDLETE